MAPLTRRFQRLWRQLRLQRRIQQRSHRQQQQLHQAFYKNNGDHNVTTPVAAKVVSIKSTTETATTGATKTLKITALQS